MHNAGLELCDGKAIFLERPAASRKKGGKERTEKRNARNNVAEVEAETGRVCARRGSVKERFPRLRRGRRKGKRKGRLRRLNPREFSKSCQLKEVAFVIANNSEPGTELLLLKLLAASPVL